MRLRVTVDQQYWQTPDGQAWTRMPPAYAFFESHLEVFNSVEILARTIAVEQPPTGSRLASGPGVIWRPVERYAGLRGFSSAALPVLRSILQGRGADALLLRGPSHLANLAFLSSPPIALGVEVLGDPAMLYRDWPLHRAWFSSNLRRQCRRAVAAGFVSKELERAYPSPNSHRLLDTELPPEAFAAPRSAPDGPCFRLVSVGGFDHPVKGHDVTIRAIAQCPKMTLTIVGGGRLQGELERFAGTLGANVTFTGQLGGAAAVRDILRQADLFVMASRTEGMPRALVEALALGIPAVATRVGGIPELLPPEQLVAPDEPASLARTIQETLADPERYARLSREGIVTAGRYAHAEVTRQRRVFLQEIRDAADQHTRGRRVYAC